MAPPQAIELSLQALRVDDAKEPGNTIVWGPAHHLAAAPRKYVRLLGLGANAWARRAIGDPLLPEHLLEDIRLPSADIADDDRMMHDIIVNQSADYTLSRGHRSATGALQAAGTLWRRDQERIVGRSAIPRHAFSQSDRLYARPADAGIDLQPYDRKTAWKDALGAVEGERRAGEAADQFERVSAAYRMLIGSIAQTLVHELAAILSEVVDAYDRRKRDAAVLDFDDLLRQARTLVCEHPEIRDWLAGRYPHLLVDEARRCS